MPPARSPSSPAKPLLPLASQPTSPGSGGGRPPLHQHAARRRARRVLLLGLLAFCLVNAAWGSRALFRTWRQHGGSNRSSLRASVQPAAGERQQEAAATATPAGGAASAKAASAADNAVEAALDAGAALRDAAGVVKHTAVAAGQAAGAAASLAVPAAIKAAAAVGNATTKAASALAGTVGNATAKAGEAAGGAASGAAASAAGTAGQAAGAAAHAAKAGTAAGGVKFVWEERPGGLYPPAELPAAVVDAASNDSCAQALSAPKVALLFLTRGPMPLEHTWRRWFASAAGLLPAREAQAAACAASPAQFQALRQACNATQQPGTAAFAASAAGSEGKPGQRAAPGALGAAAAAGPAAIDGQHLFSVYVHAPPSFKGYPPSSLWHDRLILRRTETAWADMSLVEATRSLLWEAFRDPLNQRFVLLSESDIPLYDPLTLYQQLLSEGKSRINACPHEGLMAWRWSYEMQTPHMNFYHWRKSGQFMGLTRAHVAAVLGDSEVYRSFERHCWFAWSTRRNAFRDCVPDEHYFATLLAVLGREGEADCANWGVAAQDWGNGGAHPKAFAPEEVSPALVQRMRNPAVCNGSSAAYTDAQRQFVIASEALPADCQVACAHLTAAAAAAGPYRALPAACPLTARKFPAASAAAVAQLFNSSCGAAASGSSGSEAVRLLSERRCEQPRQGQGVESQGAAGAGP